MVDPRALYESDDVAWLRNPDATVEGTWVERKSWASARKIAEAISAFANGQPPGGLIVIGAEKDGALPGVAARGPAVNELVPSIHQHVEGGWEHRFVPLPGGGKLLYIFVPFSPDRVVRLSDGGVFRRFGSSTVELKPEQYLELRYARGEAFFEDEPAAPFSEEALDPELAQSFLEKIPGKNGLTLPIDLRSALRDRHLLVERAGADHLTHAGLLLLAKDVGWSIPGARLRFFRFEGTEELVGEQRNVVKDRWFDGAVPKIVASFDAFMATQVREFDYLKPDMRFANEPEYPRDAWHEAVVNALVHRSYSLHNVWVTVKMFEDRVEIKSPGGFPAQVRPDPDGVISESKPRNPHLAGGLWYFELVRMAHEGTRRMHEEMVKAGLPAPEIHEMHDGQFVRVVLRNDIKRRRARKGTGEAHAKWEEVTRLLGDDYALYRQRGIQQWDTLQQQGAPVPQEVIARGIELLRDPAVSPSDADAVLSLLQRVEAAGTRLTLATALMRGDFLGGGDRGFSVAKLISTADDAVELVLRTLETGTQPPAATEAAFLVLQRRVNRDPLPPREWIERVLQVCVHNAGLERARSVYETVTGRRLDRA